MEGSREERHATPEEKALIAEADAAGERLKKPLPKAEACAAAAASAALIAILILSMLL
jgi:hypothetical protein